MFSASTFSITEPPLHENPPTQPFEKISMDIFPAAGFESFVITGNYSGWLVVKTYGKNTTYFSVISVIERPMDDIIYSARMRTDGVPLFNSNDFAT